MNNPLSQYRSGGEGILYWAVENPATYPGTGNGIVVPAPPLPTSVFWAGVSENPTVTRDDGTREVYGIGSNAVQAIIPGGAVITQDITTRLTNKALIQKLFYDAASTSYRGVPDLCLVSGWSNERGDGASFATRYAKCASVSFSMNEGSAQDVTVSAQMRGLAVETAPVVTPAPSDLLLFGAPLTWHNLTQVMVNGVNVRDVISSITITSTIALENKGFRNDFGVTSPWSRTVQALLPGQRSARLELNFHSPDVRAGILGLSGSGTSVGEVSVVVDDTGSSIVGGGTANGGAPRIFTFTMGPGRIANSVRRGGDSAQELMSSASVICSTCVLT